MSASDASEVGRRPRQRRSAERRRALYEESVRQFAANGVEATRVEDVVAAVGASWGTFFRYFPRKEDVLLEMGAEHLRLHVRPLADAALAEERPTRDAVRAVLLALAPADHSPALHAAALRELMRNAQRFAAMQQDGEMPFVVLLHRLLAEGQRRGEVRGDVDALSLALTVAAGAMLPMVQLGFAAGLAPEEVLRRSFSVLWPGLEPGAAEAG